MDAVLDLLKCSICPKQPSFSDVSHLLTHVSSKGHLSHLHKLQVRSHQEVEAGLLLINYNKWYDHHGLAGLLSERMVLKQAKKAGRKKTAAEQGAYVTETGATAQPPQDQVMQLRRGEGSRSQRQKRSVRTRRSRPILDNDSDFEYSPVKRYGFGPPQALCMHTLTKSSRSKPRRPHVVSPVNHNIYNNDDSTAPRGHQPLATPEHSKLKGTIWPGMDLFDAATEEMKRKRNQKKDGSVVRHMQRLAALVEPTEVVYSPSGNMMKARHIDDLEDTSSLIDGESPIPKTKQVRPRKRQPLKEKDTNAPRLVKRKSRNTPLKKRARQALDQSIPPLPYLPSSSTGESYTLGPGFLQMEDDEEDWKPMVGNGSRKKRSSQFTIFDDGSPGYGPATPADQRRNPFQVPPPPYLNSERPQLPTISASWLQPQHQAGAQYAGLYSVCRPMSRDSQDFYDTGRGKENALPFAGLQSDYRTMTTNPLSWKSPVRDGITLPNPPGSPLSNIFGVFPLEALHEDPFVSTKNPLADALEHFEEEMRSTDTKVPPSLLQNTTDDEDTKPQIHALAAISH
ncbi:hypothetical protein PV08_04923 [Exophiala spinifera]|uniref:Uncharacterized protein n=1 Tax=Exophiala spinifera TaxID=91928 RepID=A0A0D2BFE9_9EURO|nr:uncharacterized protein PV08_04923 [Exophiala spinifera]KIW17728.1 hypothetical protein PV08_04923 [Exophiala spinifera]